MITNAKHLYVVSVNASHPLKMLKVIYESPDMYLLEDKTVVSKQKMIDAIFEYFGVDTYRDLLKAVENKIGSVIYASLNDWEKYKEHLLLKRKSSLTYLHTFHSIHVNLTSRKPYTTPPNMFNIF